MAPRWDAACKSRFWPPLGETANNVDACQHSPVGVDTVRQTLISSKIWRGQHPDPLPMKLLVPEPTNFDSPAGWVSERHFLGGSLSSHTAPEQVKSANSDHEVDEAQFSDTDEQDVNAVVAEERPDRGEFRKSLLVSTIGQRTMGEKVKRRMEEFDSQHRFQVDAMLAAYCYHLPMPPDHFLEDAAGPMRCISTNFQESAMQASLPAERSLDDVDVPTFLPPIFGYASLFVEAQKILPVPVSDIEPAAVTVETAQSTNEPEAGLTSEPALKVQPQVLQEWHGALKRLRTGPESDEAIHRKIRWRTPICEPPLEITPYSEVYGQHPGCFDFDEFGERLPRKRGPAEISECVRWHREMAPRGSTEWPSALVMFRAMSQGVGPHA